MLTPQQQSFLSAAALAAVQSESTTGVPAELTLSQAIFESGWGARMPHNNCFGIKTDGHGCGKQAILTHEFLNGKWLEESLDFEAYRTLADCFADHSRLLINGAPYQQAWTAFQMDHDVDSFIRGVAAKYATDPSYADKIIGEAHSGTVTMALAAARLKAA